VRNRRDGRVEAVFAGEADAVQTMLDKCRRGPPGAVVTLVEIVGEGVSAAAGFEVLGTV
jgi:acylphosphatase